MSEALKNLLESPEFAMGNVWQTLEFTPGQEIITEGDAPTELYLLLEGCVRVLGNAELDDKRTGNYSVDSSTDP